MKNSFKPSCALQCKTKGVTFLRFLIALGVGFLISTLSIPITLVYLSNSSFESRQILPLDFHNSNGGS